MTRLRHLVGIAHFEALRVLRDTNVLLYAAFPVLGFPLLYLFGLQLLGLDPTKVAVRVAVDDPELASVFAEAPFVHVAGAGLSELDRGAVDAVITREGPVVSVHHRASNRRSQEAQARVVEALRDDRMTRLRQHAEDAGFKLVGVHERLTDTRTALVGKVLGLVLSILLPTILVLSAPTPALELFVVDRDKGGLDALLATGARRVDVLVARLAVCALIPAVAAGFGLLALLVVAAAFLAQLEVEVALLIGLVRPLWLAIPVALLASATTLATVLAMAFSLAKNYREAQMVFAAVVYALMALLGLGFAAAAFDPTQRWPIPFAQTPLIIAGLIDGTLPAGTLAVMLGAEVAFCAVALAAWHGVFGVSTLITGLPRPAWMVERFEVSP